MWEEVTSANPVWGLLAYNCASPMQRLTTDKASLINQINSLVPYDNTYIPEGLIWGWRTLSPSAPFGDGAAYNSGTKKILILLTDGVNTNEPNPTISYPNNESWPKYGPGNYYNSEPNDTKADATMYKVCKKIQAAGIDVYTISLMIDDHLTQSQLYLCASKPGNFYNASDVTGLQAAFANIGGQLTTAHLVQ